MDVVVEATDLETARYVLSSTYGSIRINARGQRRGLRLAQMSAGPIRFDHVRCAMEFEAVSPPMGALYFGQVAAGRFRCGRDGRERDYLPGQVYLTAQPELPCSAEIQDTDIYVVVIDPALPSQVADTAPGRAQAPVRFTGYEPVSAQAAETWKATVAYMRDCLSASNGAAAEPLVAASTAHLLVATTLATFPNNALTDPTIEDRHDGSPATLRRAVAYIEEHAGDAITVADIAAAARVTIRAVQLAFRRHLDTTPLRYLRQVRLDHAHRQLIAADPGYESVAATAYRWGFASPSRFATYYRAAYGVPPSHTLHQR